MGRQGGKAPANPLQESIPSRLDAVGRPLAAAAAGFGQGQIQPEGEVGLEIGRGDAFELLDQGQGQAPAIALVGRGGAAEAITEHPVAGRQGRGNPLLHVLGPVGGIEQQFGRGLGGRLAGGMEQQLAQGQAQGGAPRLPGHQEFGAGGQQATPGQPLRQGGDLGGLAAAIDPLQHQKAAPGQGGPGGIGEGRLGLGCRHHGRGLKGDGSTGQSIPGGGFKDGSGRDLAPPAAGH